MRKWLDLPICKDVRRMIRSYLTPLDIACSHAAHCPMTKHTELRIILAANFVTFDDARAPLVMDLIMKHHVERDIMTHELVQSLMRVHYNLENCPDIEITRFYKSHSLCRIPIRMMHYRCAYAIMYAHPRMQKYCLGDFTPHINSRIRFDDTMISIFHCAAIAIIMRKGRLAAQICASSWNRWNIISECMRHILIQRDGNTLLNFLTHLHSYEGELRDTMLYHVKDFLIEEDFPETMRIFRRRIARKWVKLNLLQEEHMWRNQDSCSDDDN